MPMTLRLSAEEIFRQLADSLVMVAGPDGFLLLAERLAQLLEMDHVVIGEVVDDGSRVRTLAVWSLGAGFDNFTYDLAGTPCAEVIGRDVCLYQSELHCLFPDDPVIAALAAESYLGIPLLSRDGRHIGVLALLRNRRLELSAVGREAVRIAAAQIGAELDRQRAELAVRESERRLHTLMNHLPGMAYQCRDDERWTMLFVSAGAEALTGYPAPALLGPEAIAFCDLIHPDERSTVSEQVRQAVAQRQPYRLTYRLRTASGQWRWMWEQGQGVFDPDGALVQLEGFITDITIAQQAHRSHEAVVQIALGASSAIGTDFYARLAHHLATALRAAGAIVATVAWHGDEPVLEAQAVVFGGRQLSPTSMRLADTPCPDLLEHHECVVSGRPLELPGIVHGPLHGCIGRRLDNGEGEAIGALLVFFPQEVEDDEFPRSVLRIVAAEAVAELERQKHDRRIHQLAYYDSTTGLLNRAGFMEALQEVTASGDAAGLLILDLRRFKEINDTHGHEVGDQLLAAVAARFAQAAEPPQLLARLASDEFALLLPGASVAATEQVLKVMHQALAAPVVIDEREFALEVSVGGAHYPSDTDQADELFQHASIALFHAKENRDLPGCRFEPPMVAALHRRQQMVSRFTRALQQGELELHYQPQFDLATGALVGAEALCRWHDAEWGWVSPAEFIPLAEERGLMTRLGEQVLSIGADQLRAWQAARLPLPGRLSINVSAQQFGNPQLAAQVAQLTAGLPPGCVGIELTESSLMRDPAQAVTVTQTLQAAGFRVSIDDFGTGYSSLSYLKRFAADTLKIDRSFIQDMLDDPHDLAIVTTIIAMARSLGMLTVAEGVETAEQAQRLAELGCEQVQGFFYGRPVPAATFTDTWLRPRVSTEQGRPDAPAGAIPRQ